MKIMSNVVCLVYLGDVDVPISRSFFLNLSLFNEIDIVGWSLLLLLLFYFMLNVLLNVKFSD